MSAVDVSVSQVFQSLHEGVEELLYGIDGKPVLNEITGKPEKRNRIIVNEGSSRSTKTFSIIQYLIGRALGAKIRITAARLKSVWCDETIIPDFKEIMRDHFKLWDDRSWNKTEKKYTFSTGSELKFTGLDEPQKAHGKKQHITWINEAMEADKDSYRQLAMRTIELIILDYNPSAEQHWIFDSVVTRDDCKFIKSTYKDNPWLEKAIVEEIERLEPTPKNMEQGTADEVLWKIYGLGERAAHRGLIFPDAKIVDEMPSIDKCTKHFYGLDFGYTNSPTALVDVRLYNGELYLDEKIYERKLINRIDPKNPDKRSIEGLFVELGIPKDVNMWCDPAEPKTIEDLNNAGWHLAQPAKKGKDSIVNGIMAMKRYPINITSRSVNGIKEKHNYKWFEDRSGQTTNVPVKAFDHFWDGARYGCIMEVAMVYESNRPAIIPSEEIARTRMHMLARKRDVDSSFD